MVFIYDKRSYGPRADLLIESFIQAQRSDWQILVE